MADIFDIIPFTDWESLPDLDLPHYVAAKEGLYLRKGTALGRSVTPMDTMPRHLGSLGATRKNGYFTFTAPKLPSEIVGKTLDFFKKVYDKHKSEAEVLLTYNYEKQQYRIFIPSQKCTTGSVKSAYDPAKIQRGWQVIGTIHSHASFGAFHSGTDIDDATNINGLHITIGNVNTTPTFAAMVFINGVQFTYDAKVLADLNDLDKYIAPDWWLHFVEPEAIKELPKHIQTAWDDEDNWLSKWNKNDHSSYGKYQPTTYQQRDYSAYQSAYQNTWNPSERWSQELRTYVPNWAYNISTGKIYEQMWEDLIDHQLEELAKLAEKHGIAVVYDLATIVEEPPKEPAKKERSKKDKIRALLPAGMN